MPNVLLVDDDTEFCEAASLMLEILGHDITSVHTLEAAHNALAHHKFDHVLLDFMLPDGSGLHLIDSFKGNASAPYITLITGHPSVKNLLAGMCSEKVNYLVKPLSKEKIERALSTPNKKASEDSGISKHFGCLVGESPVMRELYTMIERVAKTNANVMLLGESGVGKEVVAQAIHYATHGHEKSIVAANCGAFSRELIGSELFGHEKGAFTGAVARKTGVFEQADGGSLFLDEVTEMPLDIQPNLLRVLETGKVTRVGGVKDFTVDCRVISATNRTFDDLAENQVLREDLYFRLAVFPINIPPLRARTEDIDMLSDNFLDVLNKENGTHFCLSDEQRQRLKKYDWPGNVRELRHVMHRAFIMSDTDSTELALPMELSSPFTKAKKPSNQMNAGQKIDDVERELIRVTLEQLDGDKPKAADMLGISLKTLYNRLNKYGETI